MTTAQLIAHTIVTLALLATGVVLLTVVEDETELGASILGAGVLYATTQGVRASKIQKDKNPEG